MSVCATCFAHAKFTLKTKSVLQLVVYLLSYSRLKVENENASGFLYGPTKCTVSQILV